jgi:hypothetical protein
MTSIPSGQKLPCAISNASIVISTEDRTVEFAKHFVNMLQQNLPPCDKKLIQGYFQFLNEAEATKRQYTLFLKALEDVLK